MSHEKYVIGVDFGTDSVRSVIVDTANGKGVASHVSFYKRWAEGLYCNPAKNQFRQHPLDYIESFEESITESIMKTDEDVVKGIVGIGIDTTGSTPAPVNEDGDILALNDEFKDNPNAMFILWKDHTSVEEAEEINNAAWNKSQVDYTKYVGGIYSSEWFWAKILHVLRNDEVVRKAAFSWVEHADWMPALLTGNKDPLKIKRSRCAAGHKAMWNKEWGGLPPEEFLVMIDPLFKGLRSRLYTETYASDRSAGKLTGEWAKKLGVPSGIDIAIGAFDAHIGAVGSEVGPRRLVKIMGTSCCDMAVAEYDVIGDKLIKGICGQVDGSVIPGMVGLEAGQSAFGDIYAWFRDILLWPIRKLREAGEIDDNKLKKAKDMILDNLAEEASKLDDNWEWPVSLDWHNGRRSPYADQKLKGAIMGLTLGTDPARIFKALVESTAFGARAIIDRFKEDGVEFDDIVASGGIPKKSFYVMQILSDVLGIPVKVARSDQAGALGAAMFAAVASGIYGKIEEAQKAMGQGFEKTYFPSKEKKAYYDELYDKYCYFAELLENTLRK